MTRVLSGRCRTHVERDAIGVCVRCGHSFCEKCVTRLDGINHCLRCLQELRASLARPRRRRDRAGAVFVLLVVSTYGAIALIIAALVPFLAAKP